LRKTIGISAIALSCLIAQGSMGSIAPAAPGDDKPNILVIVTDDQREGLEVMPNTTGLIGGSGIRFSNAYVTTPNCCPSRSSIFSGRYAHNHGVRTNHLVEELNHGRTIQRYLSDAGYKNGIFGKFLNGWNLQSPPPFFDDFAILRGGTDGPRYVGGTWNVNGTIDEIETYSTTFIQRQALGFLGERNQRPTDDDPWFMYVAPNAPHAPSKPARKYRDADVPGWSGNPAVFEEDKSDKPAFVQESNRTFETARSQRRRQYRTLMSVDDLVASLYERMAKLGELENTIVLYTSDNGIMWAEHGLAGKRVPYLQATSVPMLMSWPGHTSPNSTDSRMVANIDIAPTLIDATDLEGAVKHTMDGRSLLDTTWSRDRLLFENWGHDWASTLTNEYVFSEYYDAGGAVEFREYYDLASDPWQLDNLLGDLNPLNDPLNKDELEGQLTTDRTCSGADCP
jgi:arylsulfatase A-like enzyme